MLHNMDENLEKNTNKCLHVMDAQLHIWMKSFQKKLLTVDEKYPCASGNHDF
jgi:hypothetical protein